MIRSGLVYGAALTVALACLNLLLPSSCSAQAPKVVIEGYIRQMGTGAALEGDVNVIEGVAARVVTNYRTDSRGHFRFESAAAGQKILVAKAPGHVSVTRVLAPPTGPMVEVNFQLAPAVKVSGWITDTKGVPVDGATVRVLYPGEPLVFALEQEIGNAQTDASGRFVLPYVRSQANFVLEISKPGYLPAFSPRLATQAAAIKDLRVQVEMRRGGAIRGVVEDRSGRSIPGVVLDIRALAAVEPAGFVGSSVAALEATSRRAVTSPDGRFSLAGLPLGPVVLVARHEAYKPAKVEVPVPGEDQTVEIRLTLEKR
jgi:hypothetical protein